MPSFWLRAFRLWLLIGLVVALRAEELSGIAVVLHSLHRLLLGLTALLVGYLGACTLPSLSVGVAHRVYSSSLGLVPHWNQSIFLIVLFFLLKVLGSCFVAGSFGSVNLVLIDFGRLVPLLSQVLVRVRS